MTALATPLPATSSMSRKAMPAVLILAASSLLCLIASISHQRLLFLAFGLASVTICLLPVVLLKSYDLMSPWSSVLAMVAIGVGLRSLYISFGWEGERTIDELFLRGRGMEYFTYPGLVVLLSLALMALGTVVRLRRSRSSRSLAVRFRAYSFSPHLPIVIMLCQVIAFAAFILYAQRTGGLSPDRLSAKRTTISGLDLAGDADYRSYNSLRVLNSLAPLSYLLYLASVYSRGIVNPLRSWRGALLVAMFANSILLPTYASSRTDALYVIIMAAVVRHYCAPRTKGSGRSILSTVVIVAVGFSILTAARNSTDFGPTDALSTVSVDQVVGAIVYNRNLVEIPKTAHVINRVPESLPYQNGATYAAWVVAPVPREIWNSKPLINSGPVLGVAIYGNERAGVPPGFIAEAYWNFGLPGVVVGSFLLGAFLAFLYRFAEPSKSANPVVVVVYAVGVVRLGPYVLGNSLGSGIFNMAMDTVLLMALLRVCGSRRIRRLAGRPSRPAWSGG